MAVQCRTGIPGHFLTYKYRSAHLERLFSMLYSCSGTRQLSLGQNMSGLGAWLAVVFSVLRGFLADIRRSMVAKLYACSVFLGKFASKVRGLWGSVGLCRVFGLPLYSEAQKRP